jgi:hypothetical protein
MSLEDQTTDHKSSRMISGKSGWQEIAKGCVCFVGSKSALFSNNRLSLSQKKA